MSKNQNIVELIGIYGDDKTHALSAWTSTNRELTEEKINRIPKLLKMLAEAGHHTPFEKSSLHFLITCDIATHIQILKHRIGVSVNAESARYKELKEDKYYLPIDFDMPVKNSTPLEKGGFTWKELLEEHTKSGLELYHSCLRDLIDNHGINKKRAKEIARYFRGYNTQITQDIMFNFRSLMNFYKLRAELDENHLPIAQIEIYYIAEEMISLIKETGQFKYSLKAFGI